MTPLNQACNEALAAFEIFRRLGFPADEIFFGDTEGKIYVQIRHKGKTFTVTTETHGAAREDFVVEFTMRASEWNGAMTDAERAQIYENSSMRQRASEMLMSMAAVGIVPPKALS